MAATDFSQWVTDTGYRDDPLVDGNCDRAEAFVGKAVRRFSSLLGDIGELTQEVGNRCDENVPALADAADSGTSDLLNLNGFRDPNLG